MYRILAILLLLAVTCFVGVIGDTSSNSSYHDISCYGIDTNKIDLPNYFEDLGNIVDNTNNMMESDGLLRYNALSVIDSN